MNYQGVRARLDGVMARLDDEQDREGTWREFENFYWYLVGAGFAEETDTPLTVWQSFWRGIRHNDASALANQEFVGTIRAKYHQTASYIEWAEAHGSPLEIDFKTVLRDLRIQQATGVMV